MSTVSKVNFEPVRDIIKVQRVDIALADQTLADPMNSVSLVDGEWMTLNSSHKLVRGAAIGTLGTAGAGGRATLRCFPLWAERGRTDIRAMPMNKAPVLWQGDFEFDTRIFDASAVVDAGGAIASILQPLKVATIQLGSRNYCGLVGHGGAADTAPIVGYVTRLPANNGGKLRFISGWRQ